MEHRDYLYIIHLINTIGNNKTINKDFLKSVIDDNYINKVSFLSAVGDHFRSISLSYPLYYLINRYRKKNVYELFGFILMELYRYRYMENFKKYKNVFDRVIRYAFYDFRKVSLYKSIINQFYRVRNYDTFLRYLEEFTEKHKELLKSIDFEVLNFGANTDLKIIQIERHKYIANLHNHYAITLNVSIKNDRYSKNDIRDILTLVFHILHILSIIHFNFRIRENFIIKRKNLGKFAEFVKFFVNLPIDSFISPILFVSCYTFDKEKLYLNNSKGHIIYKVPLDKKINWELLTLQEISGKIDIITNDKNFKKYLKNKGFKLSITYYKGRKRYTYRRNIRKKIIRFNKEVLENLINSSKYTLKGNYVKHMVRKNVIKIVERSQNIEDLVEKLNEITTLYIKFNNYYGISFISKVVKLYNYFVISGNIDDFNEIKYKILKYLRVRGRRRKHHSNPLKPSSKYTFNF